MHHHAAFQTPVAVPPPVQAIPREQFDEYMKTVGNLANTVRAVGEEVSSAIRRFEDRLDESEALIKKNTQKLKEIMKILQVPHMSSEWYLSFTESIKRSIVFDPSTRMTRPLSVYANTTPSPFVAHDESYTGDVDISNVRSRKSKTSGKTQ
jgi:hypothetical protein